MTIEKTTETFYHAEILCSLKEYLGLNICLEDYDCFKNSYPELDWSVGTLHTPQMECRNEVARLQEDILKMLK